MRYIPAAAVLLVLALASPATGLDTIGIYSDQFGFGYDIDPQPFMPFTAYVVVHGDALTGAAFSVSMPDGGPNLIVLDPVVLSGFLAVGDAYSGLEVAFGSCLVEPAVAVVALHFFLNGPIEGCGELRVLPHPAIGHIQTVDCGGVAHPAGEALCQYLGDDVLCALPAAPSNPSPQDGSTGVDVNTELTWTFEYWQECPGISPLFSSRVYFGTAPNPPLAWGDQWPPFDPGDLLPATTYYWKVVQWRDRYPEVESPVWSFTTATPVATKPSTWGAIKALYR